MNKHQYKGHWKQLEGEAKRRWGKLSDDDWEIAKGDMEKLAGRIQEKYGDTKEVVMNELSAIMKSLSESAIG